jgi:glucoamylase
MATTRTFRSRAASGTARRTILTPTTSPQEADLQVVAQHMFSLLLRNVASDGFLFQDPVTGQESSPGCVVAAPSFPANTPGVDQDYVYNWTRDAAITAMAIAAANLPTRPGAGVQTLIDYVRFAHTCQVNATPTLGHACFTITGQSRDWTEQSDGPALQTLAILQAYGQLDAPTQGLAAEVVGTNIGYLLGAYQAPTTNLWEEHQGLSFFARSVQLRCFQALAGNTCGIAVPPGVNDAIAWLQSALQDHWNGSCYVSLLAPPAPGAADAPALPPTLGYDPNIDIVSASVYGAVPCTDTRLLATAARLRSLWADPGSPSLYPINSADQARGLGPLFGRYGGDCYDGDVADPVVGGHPWALCSCNFAQLCYTLASTVAASGTVPYNALSAPFFSQVGVASGTSAAAAAAALTSAGDAILRAVIFHSDGLELSEQFDGTTGFEKSVRNLTWSYAAFLSAVRARNV